MACILEIKVVPSSGRQTCILDASGVIKCYLKSPPEAGKANRELIKLLAAKLAISPQAVTILTGFTSPKKKIKIEGTLLVEDCYKLLGLEIQKRLV